MNDPRGSSRYKQLAKAYIAARIADRIPCALCSGLIIMTAPRTSPLGPTIEHTVPIRKIRAMAAGDWERAVELACHTAWWRLAHYRCQARQGAGATNARRQKSPRRRW